MRRSNFIWPLAAYEGRFAGGETIRLGIGVVKGRPFDFERARRGVALIIGNERGRAAVRADASDPARRYLIGKRVKHGVTTMRAVDLTVEDLLYAVFPPADDQVGGWMEHGDVVHLDPAFGRARAIVRARTPIITTPTGKRAFGF